MKLTHVRNLWMMIAALGAAQLACAPITAANKELPPPPPTEVPVSPEIARAIQNMCFQAITVELDLDQPSRQACEDQATWYVTNVTDGQWPSDDLWSPQAPPEGVTTAYQLTLNIVGSSAVKDAQDLARARQVIKAAILAEGEKLTPAASAEASGQ